MHSKDLLFSSHFDPHDFIMESAYSNKETSDHLKHKQLLDEIINNTIQRPNSKLIMEQAKSEVLKEAYKVTTDLLGEKNVRSDFTERYFQILSEYDSPITDNLLKLFIGAVKAGSITGFEETKMHLLEITSQVLISEYIRASAENNKEQILKDYESISYADNPPYALSDPRAKQVFEEVLKVHLRGKSIRHAFSVLMFDSRRPPTKEPPLLTRFGNDSAQQTYYIDAKDIDLFPGRGFMIQGLIPEKLFVSNNSKEKGEDSFKTYKEAWPHLSQDFEAVKDTNFIFTRGAIVVSTPNDKSCEIMVGANGEKEHYSYVIFNDHFGGKDFKHTGSESICLVPTRLIQGKLKDTLVPYEDFSGYGKAKKDINDSGLNLPDILKEANTLNLPVLKIGSGSTFAGGLCNAWEPGKKWFYGFQDEVDLLYMPGVMKDAWGHTHKGDMLGFWTKEITPELEKKFISMRQAHDEVFSVTTKFQNRLELFLLGYGNWLKGFTVSEFIDEVSADESLAVNDDKENDGLESDPDWWKKDEDGNVIYKDSDEATFQESEQSKEPDSREEYDLIDLKKAPQELGFIDDKDKTLTNPNSLRMLVEAYKWHNGGKEKGITDKDFYPIIALGPSTDLWTIKDSPFYLDTFDMRLYVGDEEIYQFPEHKIGKGDFEAEEIWHQVILPHFNGDNVPRLYHRKDLKR